VLREKEGNGERITGIAASVVTSYTLRHHAASAPCARADVGAAHRGGTALDLKSGVIPSSAPMLSPTRRRWPTLADTRVRYAWRRVVRDGVGVLLVRLRGASGDRADDVARVRDGLDALGASFDDVDVSVLDVREFSNAYGDEAAILTTVFEGVPCCWVTFHHADQVDGCRWDLPHRERLAPTVRDAVVRAVAWRRVGGFTHTFHVGECALERRWTDRGLECVAHRNGAVETRDVFYRNRLVERVMPRVDQRVLWPVADQTGARHDALRLGARVVLRGDRVVEVDWSPWQTRRPPPPDWIDRSLTIPSTEELVLLSVELSDDDLDRLVAGLPALRLLRLDRTRLSDALTRRLRDMRPDLQVR
jgi:hypothetical protein